MTPTRERRAPFLSGDAGVVLAGAAVLLSELAVIRYVPGQIRVLGYFTNFVLLAAFVGCGAGILLARRRPSAAGLLTRLAPAALLALVAAIEAGRRLHVIPSPEQVLFLEYATGGRAVRLDAFLAAAFAALAAAMLPLGCAAGLSLHGDRPLRRYALNVAGSLLGIALFAALSVLGAPPWTWLAAAGGLAAALSLDAPLPWRAGGLAAAAAAGLIAASATRGAVWSPYQKITVAEIDLLPEKGIVQEWRLPELSPDESARLQVLDRSEGFTIRVNDDSYQTPVDVSDAELARRPGLSGMRTQFDLPFLNKRSRADVLVLGAGSGNDVAAALRAGAEHVDAVEIDPEILKLGREHPLHPYEDPRVAVHVADARHFLARTNRLYDVIVFGLLDSHVLLSSQSNIRLDSFVFTRESFEAARRRLKPGGYLYVSHAVGSPWFFERMRATLAAAFGGKPPFILNSVYHPIGLVYAAGDTVRPGPGLTPGTEPLTDDWPFPYLQGRAVPADYLVAMLIIALSSLAAVRGLGGAGAIEWPFFFLGGGFLLLETRGLTAAALLLGSTWQVTSAVFAGVLAMALLATGVAARFSRWRPLMNWAYALLWLALLLNFLIPMSALIGLPYAGGVLAGTTLVSLPLLASGTIFALCLERAGSADRAVASNLLGAMAGGLLENLSMLTGFRNLLLVAAAFYALSRLSQRRAR